MPVEGLSKTDSQRITGRYQLWASAPTSPRRRTSENVCISMKTKLSSTRKTLMTQSASSGTLFTRLWLLVRSAWEWKVQATVSVSHQRHNMSRSTSCTIRLYPPPTCMLVFRRLHPASPQISPLSSTLRRYSHPSRIPLQRLRSRASRSHVIYPTPRRSSTTKLWSSISANRPRKCMQKKRGQKRRPKIILVTFNPSSKTTTSYE